MVTVSDFAAMGVRPGHALVSMAAPAGTDLERLGDGLAEAAEEAACVVVGGDLAESPVLVVSTAVFGLAEPGGPAPLLRSGARPGDRLFVTGPLGPVGRRPAGSCGPAGAGAHPRPSDPDLVRAHRRPVARLAEGEAARRAGASAAIDLSDGLAADLAHLAAASGVGVALDAVPVADGATAEEALAGGEDYELLVATGAPGRPGGGVPGRRPGAPSRSAGAPTTRASARSRASPCRRAGGATGSKQTHSSHPSPWWDAWSSRPGRLRARRARQAGNEARGRRRVRR